MNLLRKKRTSPSPSARPITPTSKGEKALPSVGAATEKRGSIAAPPPALLLRDNSDVSPTATCAPVGTGRTIPILQGFLMKKQDGNMKRDWKRRYVTLTHTQLVYYPTLNDYRGSDSGKSIDLRFCTVKTSGVSPRTQTSAFAIPSSQMQNKNPCSASLSCDTLASNPKPLLPTSASSHMGLEPTTSSPLVGGSAANRSCSFKLTSQNHRRSGSEALRVDQFFLSPSSSNNSLSTSKEENCPMSPVASQTELTQAPLSSLPSARSPDLEALPKRESRSRLNSFSRERPKIRARSNTISSSRPVSRVALKPMPKPKARDDLYPDSFDFKVVSLTGKSWAFEAFTEEEFESWTNSIKVQIQQCLEMSFSDKKKQTDIGVIKKIQEVAGNNICADCLQVDPEWASLNFGSLLCIECSAVHRNLGTHVSRVRSLSLDEWSTQLVEIMLALGNKVLISVYEGRLDEYDDHRLPVDATREDRESFIRRKYVDKDFLDHLPNKCAVKPLFQCLKDAVLSNDVTLTFHVLAYCCKSDLSLAMEGGCTVLHKAAEADAAILTQLLIWNGADVNIKNDCGDSALDVSGSKCKEILRAGGATSKQDVSAR